MDQTAHPPSSQWPLDDAATRTIVIGTMVAMFLGALDQTIVATALPTIGRELNSLAQLPWVVTAYLLTATAVTPIYGKLSDIFGRRAMLLVAIAGFLVGSIFCAIAPSIIFLIIARALQGIGGGGLISLGQTIIGDVIPPRERGRYQSYFAAVFVSASVLGPLLGGFLSESFHWSAIFWINLPIGAAAFLMTNRVLKRLPRHDRPHRIDMLGAALMVLATIALLLALSWAGEGTYSWLSRQVLGVIGLSILGWLAFAWRLSRAAEPFFPLDLLGNGVVRCGLAASFFGIGALLGLTIYLPIYFESVMGISAAQSGTALIAFMVGTVVGANSSGRIMLKANHYKRPIVLLIAATIPSTALLVIWPTGFNLVWFEIIVFVIGLSLGHIYPFSTISLQNAVPMWQLGTVTGALNFVRSLGGAILIAVFGAIFLSLGGGSAGGTGAGHPMPADLVPAFRGVFAATLIAFTAAVVWLAAIKELPLRGRIVPSIET